MTRAQRTYYLVREYNKLTPEGQRELLSYLRWLRELENHERLQRYQLKESRSRNPLRIAEQ